MYLLFCGPAGDGGQDCRWRPEADPLKSAWFHLKGQRLIAFKCGGVSCIEREANGGNSEVGLCSRLRSKVPGSSRKKKLMRFKLMSSTGSVADLISLHVRCSKLAPCVSSAASAEGFGRYTFGQCVIVYLYIQCHIFALFL